MLLRNVRVTNILKKSRFAAALFVELVIVGTACSRFKTHIDLSAASEWREGDLVLRCGWGMESRAVTLQGHCAYSHIGLLHWSEECQEWQVVHAVPGEDLPDRVKVDPVTKFFCRERAQRGAWVRIDCPDSIARQAVQYALSKVNQHILFDHDYLLRDTAQLYCTELVWQSYLHQGLDITGGRRQSVPSVFSTEGECIFPNDIEESETSLFVKPLKTTRL